MSKTVSRFALAASIALATAFTVSCTSDIETAEEFLAKLSSSSQGYSSSSVAASSSSAVLSSSSLAQSSSSSALSSSVSDVVYGTPVTYGGETYQTVVIGTQTWFAKNLNYDPGIGTSVCYSNQASDCATYGRLYDLATAMSVCPPGWHLPTYEEWNTLSSYVESNSGCSGCDARLLKATSGKYGFSALLGYGDVGSWWSAIENNSYGAHYWNMRYDYEHAYWGYDYGSGLFSVRCIKD